jgi:MFS family permease
MFGLKRVLWHLFLVNLAIGFTSQFIVPLFPLYLISLEATEIQIGLILSLASVFSTLLMIPSGVLMNRLGKKNMLIISVVFLFLSPILIALFNNLAVVTPLYVVFNASLAFFIIPRMAMITENTLPGNRATILGVMNSAWPIGGIIAPTLSGYLVENYGWTPIFLASSLLMGLSIIPTLKLPRQEEVIVKSTGSPIKISIWERKYLGFMVFMSLFHLLMGTLEGSNSTILPLYLRNQISLSPYVIGLFFTLPSVSTLFTQVLSGLLADRYGRKKILVLCLVPAPFLFILWLYTTNWIHLIIAYTIIVSFWSMTWSPSMALLSEYVPSELIGTAVGIRMTSMRLGMTIGPILSVFLYTSISHTTPFLASAIMVVMAIIFGSLIRETPDEKEEPVHVQSS